MIDVHSHRANTIKSRAYQALVHSAPNTLTIRHKEIHARRRRILSLAFSDARMLSYESTVKGCIKALCDNLRENALAQDNSPKETLIDMSLQSDWFTFDIMSEVIFGMKYGALKKSTYRHVTQAIQDSNVRVSTLVQAYSLTTGRLDRYLFPASILARNAFLKFVTSLLRDRSKMPPSQDNGDVFSFLETAKDPDNDKTLTKSEIRAECATLVVAGSDTSSSTLAATLFYLSENQGAYKRVCQEIRQKFASLDDIKLGAQLNSCTYLRACIDEALRMSPPVGGALWREVGPGGITIGSTHLPQGVDVGTGIYSLHHNTSYFHEPFRFNPERWLAGENGITKEQVELARSAFHPFSSGPRGCIGKGFAYHEMTLTLSHILYQFDFYRAEHPTVGAGKRPVIQGHVQFLLKDHITGAKEGPELLFRLR
ncbi:hypothetical protein PTNB73_04850 [Pyrenophora teres f. teres]|nr:hypothetical protein HRS9139_05588 [Pyrenophora teres f. teres]KAE8840460.1 hypothetical protein PTNB85_03859 [Pyrenophora teres f. teres]KAE8849400.1 hypothetical protein HRS9122_03416 [Pyrenophora teres f. teres]KAE8863959.1 hypothetical protein PTNB29_03923 [Pyrenophora teres f. teres]KAE8866756.1 hypothetical protein PTNB73_04850 [Pyrenophora teres f. teres]